MEESSSAGIHQDDANAFLLFMNKLRLTMPTISTNKPDVEANAFIINVKENAEIQREANAPSGNESQNREAIGNEDQDRALCKQNEKAYTPQVISIGPLLHGDKRLETNENLKVKHFKRFVHKPKDTLNVEDLVSTIRIWKGDVRCCYAKTIQFSSNDIVKMILVNVTFIIEFFMILENATWRALDLLRTFSLPQPHQLPERIEDNQLTHLYSVSQLYEAGVKFKVSSSKCLLDLKFTKGVLEIPCLTLVKPTESIVRNILAFEQCHYPDDAYITDYFHVLDFLIDTTKDVDLLVRKRILHNRLGDSNAVATLVNSLCVDLLYSNVNSNYLRLCQDLNAFYLTSRHTWKTTFKCDYCSTPWRIASTTTAVILLGFTLLQTLCFVISLLKN
ncbi:uncharacterized protein LOC132168455 [Corylus avellana]|uniref:uncharacterized protein LOC132168455 n=1 Tax=Corylus avellana TaxID=13451 RepID=UPI00286C7359|nr:uncharacterized protein LOC132168455 [Corylus avellana]